MHGLLDCRQPTRLPLQTGWPWSGQHFYSSSVMNIPNMKGNDSSEDPPTSRKYKRQRRTFDELCMDITQNSTLHGVNRITDKSNARGRRYDTSYVGFDFSLSLLFFLSNYHHTFSFVIFLKVLEIFPKIKKVTFKQ